MVVYLTVANFSKFLRFDRLTAHTMRVKTHQLLPAVVCYAARNRHARLIANGVVHRFEACCPAPRRVVHYAYRWRTLANVCSRAERRSVR